MRRKTLVDEDLGTLELPESIPVTDAAKCKHPRVRYAGETSDGNGEWVECPDCGKNWVEEFPS